MMEGVHLQPELQKAVEDLGYTSWTDIQKQAIPAIQEGKDVIGQSKTGSGKTAAFGLPIIEKTLPRMGLQAVILVPTRELCEQVMQEMLKFSKYKRMHILAVYGGVSITPQIEKLRHSEIMVATPGRLLDHMQRGTIILNKVRTVVLDEADKMFEMGFVDDVKRILSQFRQEKQMLLFSATMSAEVNMIVKHYMKEPVRIKVQSYVEESKLVQHYYVVENKDKFSLLLHLLQHEKPELTLIFCATRRRVDVITRNLYHQGIRAQALHGGLTQTKRKEAMDMFHGKKTLILVASDIAARGLDIKEVSHVINYDIPHTSKEYIHRIGRTARAGNEGKIISLVSQPDYDNFRRVQEDRALKVERLVLPAFTPIHFVASQLGDRRGYDDKRGFHRKPFHGRRGDQRGPQRSHGSYHQRRSDHS